MKIIVDCMGGDLGSSVIVEAINNFHSKHKEVIITAVGKKEELASLDKSINVVDARNVVKMEAGALEVMRDKESSMYKAVNLAKDDNYDAVISAGSTGGFLSTSTLLLKNIEGVSRAALITAFPTKIKNKKVVVLDVGASNENSSEELYQFGVMGRLYAQSVLGIENPNTYLLSNGSEELKGSPITKAAYKLYKERNFKGFKGNIEARDALNGEADVIVMDGFTGNIFLKGLEGLAKMMSGLIKDAFKKNIFTKIGYLFTRKGIKEMREAMDYKSTGGALMVGINGVVIKAHGSSDAYSFECALNIAYKLANEDIVNKIKLGLKHE